MEERYLVEDSNRIPQVNPSGEFGQVMSSVRPMGTLGKAVVTMLAYRLESKRLMLEAGRIIVEQNRLIAQAETASKSILAQKELRLAEIEKHKECLLKGLEQYEQEIKNIHVSRKAIIDFISKTNNAINELISKDNINIEVIKELRLLIAGFSSDLVNIEKISYNKSRNQLSPLFEYIKDTKKQITSLQ